LTLCLPIARPVAIGSPITPRAPRADRGAVGARAAACDPERGLASGVRIRAIAVDSA
jgi:hypothetical protein